MYGGNGLRLIRLTVDVVPGDRGHAHTARSHSGNYKSFAS